ncbi:hypothetical protein J4727_05245 [Providencia rettgeri]|uniref:Uncharacterized protein n=1 Tax=Providencia rettgeri TaxID=587 RepID=A0A939NAD7_PRORE|nr:hypothetical protein [Providencia rettgeri]
MQSGSATVSLQDSEVDYRDEFKAPFSIKTATGRSIGSIMPVNLSCGAHH